MVADGSFDALFARYYDKLLAELNLRQRVVIELQNPFLLAWVPLERSSRHFLCLEALPPRSFSRSWLQPA